MDVVWLSRLQFAAATFFHFLFVPLTLGLSILVAIMETKYAKTNDETYLQMAKFWGKIFLVNFAIGVVTGITLEFQFGTNWSKYSTFVGDIFGSLLAIEATAAFFLESTLIGVWAFGWKKLSKKTHAVLIWLVAFASNLSAFWILVANSWMQHPVGYVMRNNRAELANFTQVIFQKWAILEFLHTISAAYILSAMFVMGISAYHILRKQNLEHFLRSFKIALKMGLIFTIFIVIEGHVHGTDLAEKQPTKLAAMEAHWETIKGAPKYLFVIPDESNERNLVELIPIPGFLSLLATHDFKGEVRGLKDFRKQDRPPVFISYFSFQLMVGLGIYFVLIMLYGWFKRDRLQDYPKYLRLVLYSIPLPYIACELGWTLAEVGRQPWIVYGILRTNEAASPLVAGQVAVTLLAFVVVYATIGIIGFGMITRFARQGIKTN
jgi:cytochrome d ubiquinol oxidase subunit I